LTLFVNRDAPGNAVQEGWRMTTRDLMPTHVALRFTGSLRRFVRLFERGPIDREEHRRRYDVQRELDERERETLRTVGRIF
jgi:hypothetical protein